MVTISDSLPSLPLVLVIHHHRHYHFLFCNRARALWYWLQARSLRAGCLPSMSLYCSSLQYNFSCLPPPHPLRVSLNVFGGSTWFTVRLCFPVLVTFLRVCRTVPSTGCGCHWARTVLSKLAVIVITLMLPTENRALSGARTMNTWALPPIRRTKTSIQIFVSRLKRVYAWIYKLRRVNSMGKRGLRVAV